MAYYVSPAFGRRLNRLERKHRRLARGGVTVLRSDGLMVLRPRRFGLFRFLGFVALVAASMIVFKAAVFTAEGPITYQARLDRLAGGTGPETMAARVMEIDPATQFVLDNAQPAIHQALLSMTDLRRMLIAESWGVTR
ncbi:MAG: hypothetical protein AAGF13_04245 [Pseudomonadota bacterium]